VKPKKVAFTTVQKLLGKIAKIAKIGKITLKNYKYSFEWGFHNCVEINLNSQLQKHSGLKSLAELVLN